MNSTYNFTLGHRIEFISKTNKAIKVATGADYESLFLKVEYQMNIFITTEKVIDFSIHTLISKDFCGI